MTEEQGNRIIQLLEEVLTNSGQTYLGIEKVTDTIPVATDTMQLLLTYGFVYVPLIMVVVMLWWFFKQFINKY